MYENNNKKNVVNSDNELVIENPSLLKPFIVNEGGYLHKESIILPGNQPFEIKLNVPKKPKLEHEIEMWNTINNFETNSWSAKNIGLKTGWKSIDKAFDNGIKSGFIVIGGDSNLGKTAFISQLAWQIAENNDDVYVMDFSLDDAMPDKLSRVVASMGKVLINAVKNPNNYTSIPGMLIRRKGSLNKVRTMVEKYRSYDANYTTFLEDIEEEIKRVKISLKAENKDKQIVVLIDNLHDVNIKNHPNLIDKNKYEYIAQWAADTSIKYDIPLICTAELKKLNSTRRPVLDDIRESTKIKYEAKAILLVYNEVHYKGESADVCFYKTNTALKQPVFEIHFAKNKIHSFKGRCFFEFYADMARMEEADEQSAKTYSNLIFGN